MKEFKLLHRGELADSYSRCPACDNIININNSRRMDSYITLEVVGGGYYKCRHCTSVLLNEEENGLYQNNKKD